VERVDPVELMLEGLLGLVEMPLELPELVWVGILLLVPEVVPVLPVQVEILLEQVETLMPVRNAWQ
jgi:hypothetical protein